MGDYPASRAERIALHLAHACGPDALDRARERRRKVGEAGNHRQVDLYTAVCTIIADRDFVFSRSRFEPEEWE